MEPERREKVQIEQLSTKPISNIQEMHKLTNFVNNNIFPIADSLTHTYCCSETYIKIYMLINVEYLPRTTNYFLSLSLAQ